MKQPAENDPISVDEFVQMAVNLRRVSEIQDELEAFQTAHPVVFDLNADVGIISNEDGTVQSWSV